MADPRRKRERPGRAAVVPAPAPQGRQGRPPHGQQPFRPQGASSSGSPLQAFDAEPEGLDPFSKLLYDTSLCLNGYLNALKAASSTSAPQGFGDNAKGAGAA
jgi:hypothetical protein